MSSERHAGPQKPVTGEEFRKACGRFATGVTIASVMDAKGTPHGLTEDEGLRLLGEQVLPALRDHLRI